MAAASAKGLYRSQTSGTRVVPYHDLPASKGAGLAASDASPPTQVARVNGYDRPEREPVVRGYTATGPGSEKVPQQAAYARSSASALGETRYVMRGVCASPLPVFQDQTERTIQKIPRKTIERDQEVLIRAEEGKEATVRKQEIKN